MTFVKTITALSMVAALGACEVAGLGNKTDKTIDRGTDRKHLSQLVAGVWVDPNGCDHWIIDDGVEGYLTHMVSQFVLVLPHQTQQQARSKAALQLAIQSKLAQMLNFRPKRSSLRLFL
jgi:hypothetical protein